MVATFVLVKFEASTFIEEGTLILKLNDVAIIQGSGKTTLEVEENQTYWVSWEVHGLPGTCYTISISSPRAAEFYLRKVLQYDRESRIFFFNINTLHNDV